MIQRLLIVLLVALPAAAAPGGSGARGLLSVLELRNKLQGADRHAVDAGYLTDRIRSEIFHSPLDVKVMTRENLITLLEASGKKLEECEGECEVDTGRNLGADFVVSGQVLRSGAALKLVLSLYETHGGTLVGSVTSSGADVDALDRELRGSIAELIAPLVQPAEAPAAGAVRMNIAAPPDGRWVLVDGDGGELCALPCTKMVPRGAGWSVEGSDRRRLSLPDPAGLRAVDARYVPARGSTVLPWVAAGGSVLLGASLFFGLESCNFTNPNGSCGAQKPGAASAMGALAGVAGLAASIAWLAWSHGDRYEASAAR